MDLKEWLQSQIAEEVGADVNEISCDQPFEDFNLDSLSLVSLSFELEKKLETDISPTVFTEFNTINKLLSWLNQEK